MVIAHGMGRPGQALHTAWRDTLHWKRETLTADGAGLRRLDSHHGQWYNGHNYKFHKFDAVAILTDDELELLDKYGMEDQKDLKRRNKKSVFIFF